MYTKDWVLIHCKKNSSSVYVNLDIVDFGSGSEKFDIEKLMS